MVCLNHDSEIMNCIAGVLVFITQDLVDVGVAARTCSAEVDCLRRSAARRQSVQQKVCS